MRFEKGETLLTETHSVLTPTTGQTIRRSDDQTSCRLLQTLLKLKLVIASWNSFSFRMKKIAIIGAGASGLPAIKTCVEDGVEPVCLERTSDIGGLWNYRETCEGQGCVMKSTIINTSKEMMCYSDFPIPQEFPNFMHNSKVLEYFRLYAEKFNLLKHIRFQTDVIKVRPVSNFAESGRWEIEIKDLKTGTTSTETFDGVIICTGHHAEKHLPHFQGTEDFQGEQLHTHDYRDYKGFDEKTVVVVGIGNSGGDVAVELSKVGKQVYLSTRRGSWVTHRVGDNGVPVDYIFNRHFIFDIRNRVPRFIVNYFAESTLNKRFDHKLYGLQPEHHFDAQHVMINDDLPNRIASGGVVVKPNIRKITKRGVEFEDGSVVDDVDVIIYATGYEFGFPYIEHKALEVKKNQVNLFKYVFPPSINPPTIAVLGCIQPLGAIMPISELQGRLAVKVIKGDRRLPSEQEMWKDIAAKKLEMSTQYVASQRHTIQVDYVTFMDELAELTGCRPDLIHLLKTDPRLAYSVYFGPATPYQYRLVGPNSWSGAREAIMSTWKRVIHPFQTRPINGRSFSGSDIIRVAIAILIFALLIRWFFG